MRKLSAFTFAALLFSQWSIAQADPPAGRANGIGASQSTLRRALDSRAGLQQRVNLKAQGSAQTGAGIEVGQNSTSSNVGVGATLEADVNGSANAQSGTGRLPREVVVRRLQLLRSQQSAAVRTASRTQLGLEIGSHSQSDSPAESGKKPQPNSKSPRGKTGQGPGNNSNLNDDTESSDRSGVLTLNGSARSNVVAHGENRLALTNADKILAQRLARIDQIRDQALESGNEQLLDQADRLELDARTQYAQRLSGSAEESSTQTSADAIGQATGTTRGRVNRARSQAQNSGDPDDGGNIPENDTSPDSVSGDAVVRKQSEASTSIRNRAQQAQNGRRPATPSADRNGKVRSASLSGQAKSTNATSATASNAAGTNSVDAAGSSATAAAANAQKE